MNNDFLSKYDTFEKRQTLFYTFKDKYPTRIPIVITTKDEQAKFLVNREITMGNLISTFRSQLKLNSNKALFFLSKNVLIPNSYTIGSVYDDMVDGDGFLYIVAREENVFG